MESCITNTDRLCWTVKAGNGGFMKAVATELTALLSNTPMVAQNGTLMGSRLGQQMFSQKTGFCFGGKTIEIQRNLDPTA